MHSLKKIEEEKTETITDEERATGLKKSGAASFRESLFWSRTSGWYASSLFCVSPEMEFGGYYIQYVRHKR